ncbi:putative membrane protein YedE/YeeE [Nocardioides thalensis]|uniref:Putative membrane protein YedE/YeeE n=1 Tax=Nocardioides thalensis TaxID=1914755 RepID=A0A853BYG7_9ACTN|nr:putative membrane protein YedE/YeeE [Nocardioides thalensis]
MKEFWIYTLLRLGLFVGSFAIVFGIWFLVADSVTLLWVIVIAFVISGIASYFLLERQREAFAVKVEGRAGKVADKLEESRSKEDTD